PAVGSERRAHRRGRVRRADAGVAAVLARHGASTVARGRGSDAARMSTYRLNPRVRWVVERYGIVLTDSGGRVRTLEYPEAAVWDLFSRGYAFDKTVTMVSHIAALDTSAADSLVRAAVDDWVAGGFLEQACRGE